MRAAATVLGIIRERGRRGLPLEDVYRQLSNPALYLLAYGRISERSGALTPGATDETADGMAPAKIRRTLGQLRQGRCRWTPVRRVRIPKKHGTTRPPGIPTRSDKLLQEGIRLILEASDEPRSSPRSHGFRPGRGCHTALTEIHHRWRGTVRFIEGDITGCFDHLDHGVLLGILRERIRDHRFLRLLAHLLNAGHLEDWTYGRTPSGSPQGGVVNPILANISLDRLDRFAEDVLRPGHTRGTRRRSNPAFEQIRSRYRKAKRLRRQLLTLPSKAPDDPDHRRLRYVRYADDFLLGFTGPRAEAEAITRRRGAFLREHRKLELSAEKTPITHGRTHAARYLGYDLVVQHNDERRIRRRCDGTVRRPVSGVIGFRVPRAVVRDKCAAYCARGKPMHRSALLHDDAFSIVARYANEFRGLVAYDRLASDLHRFQRLRWIMERSLTMTLAGKFRTSVRRVYARYRTHVVTERGRKPVLQVTVAREGRRPLVATWGRTDLVRRTATALNDAPPPVWNRRTEIVERLLADACELCGSREAVQVHHVRALKDLRQPGRRAKPRWVQMMAERRRTKLVVCRTCHVDIHARRPPRNLNPAGRVLESRVM